MDDLARWPMTKVLRDVVGMDISRITDTVEARLADPETARLLEVPLLSPILHYTGITYDTAGRVLDVAVIHYRGTVSRSRSPWMPREARAPRRTMPSVTHDDAPPLADLMPWSVAPPRARPGVADGTRRGVPQSPLGRPDEGRGTRP